MWQILIIVALIIAICYCLLLKFLEEKRSKQLENKITSELIEFFEHEIQRMGADLHDDLLQKLFSYRLLMDMISKAEDMDHVQAYAVRMKSEFDEVIQSLRKISNRLLPGSIDAPSLTIALRDLCSRMDFPSGRQTTHLHFESSGDDISINVEHQIHLIRIIQELIHNAKRHSNAWHIWVSIKYKSKSIIINVENESLNEKKIINNKIDKQDSFRTLKMRVRHIGARLIFKNGRRGPKAKIVYPVRNQLKNTVAEGVSH